MMHKQVLIALACVGVMTASADAEAAWAEVAASSRCISLAAPTASIAYSYRYAIPNFSFLKTTDGGKTWVPVTSTSTMKPGQANGGGTGLVFTDALTGFGQVEDLFGQKIEIGKTTDGGLTWTGKPVTGLPANRTIRAVSRMSFGTQKDGVVVLSLGGTAGPIVSTLVITHDAGETWTVATPPATTTNYVNAAMADASTVVASAVYPVTGGQLVALFTSHDGGVTWKKSYDTQSMSETMNQVEFLDATHGFASKKCPVIADCMLTTSDGGDTWAPTTTAFIGNQDVTAMAWADLTHGLIGSGADILQTVDGGKNWTKTTLPAGHTDSTICLAYRGPGAISGGFAKPYMVDETMGGGPRPALPAGGTTTTDAGTDATTADAATSDSATADALATDAVAADVVIADAPAADDAELADATPTPPAASSDEGGGCTTGRRGPEGALGLVVAALGLLLRRRPPMRA